MNVLVERDNATGRSRGLGFVSYRNVSDATETMKALQGRKVRGRPIIVEVAKRRPKWKKAKSAEFSTKVNCGEDDDAPPAKRQKRNQSVSSGGGADTSHVAQALRQLVDSVSKLNRRDQNSKCSTKKQFRVMSKLAVSACREVTAFRVQSLESSITQAAESKNGAEDICDLILTATRSLAELIEGFVQSTIDKLTTTDEEDGSVDPADSVATYLDKLTRCIGIVTHAKKALNRCLLLVSAPVVKTCLQSQALAAIRKNHRHAIAKLYIMWEQRASSVCKNLTWTSVGRTGAAYNSVSAEMLLFASCKRDNLVASRSKFISVLQGVLDKCCSAIEGNLKSSTPRQWALLKPYGSIYSGLDTEDSDIDLNIVLIPPIPPPNNKGWCPVGRACQQSILRHFYAQLRDAGASATAKLDTRIPLVVVHKQSRDARLPTTTEVGAKGSTEYKGETSGVAWEYECDITASAGTDRQHSVFKKDQVIRAYVDLDQRVRPLVLCIKHWARFRSVQFT